MTGAVFGGRFVVSCWLLLNSQPAPAREATAAAMSADVWSISVDGRIRAVGAACETADCSLFVLVEKRPEEEEPVRDERTVSIEIGTAGVEVDGAESDRSEIDASWSLHRWDPASPDSLTTLFEPLPELMRPRLESADHAASPALVLFGEHRVWLRPIAGLLTGGLRPLGPATFVDPSPDQRTLQLDPGSRRILAVGIGELEIFEIGNPDVLYAFRLPVEVRRESVGLRLTTPNVLPTGTDGLYAVGPQSLGTLRLQTLLVDIRKPATLATPNDESLPAGAPEETNPQDSWSVLSAPERVIATHYESIAGRPYLFATTLRSDKLSLFEKKKLRVFALRPDRTRMGRSPVLEVLTASRLWQDLEIHLVHTDDDRLKDLVLIQPEGLGGKKLIVDAYRGTVRGTPVRGTVGGVGEAGFEPKNRRSVLRRVGERSPHQYGDDWNGDGIADLIAYVDGELAIFAGLRDPRKKAVLETEPFWTLPIKADGLDLWQLEVRGGRLVGRGAAKGYRLVVFGLRTAD